MLKQLRVVSTNSVNGQLFLTAPLICQCSVCCQSKRPCSVFRCWHWGYANEHMNQLSPPQTPCVHAGGRRMCAELHWLWVTGGEGETTSFSFLKWVFFPFWIFSQVSTVCFCLVAFIRFQGGNFNLFLSRHNRREQVWKWDIFWVRPLRHG